MNEWDAPNNTKKVKYNSSELYCTKCGHLLSCVSDQGFEDYPREKVEVCNHCYGQITGNTPKCANEISSGSEDCDNCNYKNTYVNRMSCDDFNDCRNCPTREECNDAGCKGG